MRRDRHGSRRIPHDADRGTRGAWAWPRGGNVIPGPVRALAVARDPHDLASIRSGEAERLERELPTEIQPLQQELNTLIQSNLEIVDRARTHFGNLAQR